MVRPSFLHIGTTSPRDPSLFGPLLHIGRSFRTQTRGCGSEWLTHVLTAWRELNGSGLCVHGLNFTVYLLSHLNLSLALVLRRSGNTLRPCFSGTKWGEFPLSIGHTSQKSKHCLRSPCSLRAVGLPLRFNDWAAWLSSRHHPVRIKWLYRTFGRLKVLALAGKKTQKVKTCRTLPTD